MSAEVTRAGTRLDVGPLMGTKMRCAPARMDQDAWLAGLFTEAVALGATPFTITADDVVLTLDKKETPQADLTGTTWVLQTIVEGEVASSVGGEARLKFPDKASLEFHDGCNSGSAEVAVNGER